MTSSVDNGPTVASAQETAASKVAPLSGGVLAIGWAAAALANAVTFTPLLAALFLFTGQKYVDALLAGTGLASSYLDIGDRALTFIGFEIVLRSANWWVLLALVSLAYGVLLGLVIIPLASIVEYVVRRARGTPPTMPRWAKAFAAWGIVAWAGAMGLAVLYLLYAIVFVTPDRATCVGNTQYKSTMKLVSAGCAECGTFGKSKSVGISLIHGKERTVFITKEGALYLDTKSLTPAIMPSDVIEPVTISSAVMTCSGQGS